MDALGQLGLVEIREAITAKRVSAAEITRAAFARIDKHAAALGTFLALDRERAFACAADVDRKVASGVELGALAGAPIALKDNICTRGVPTTCASKILEGYVPPYDADVVERLRAADAIVIGKTNMDEFAMGSSTENSAFGPARNPWDPERTPGGSSGGSAVAVSAGFAAGSLGSDTGGSVRQPGGLTGLVAIKPTYGRVSRYGVVAFASSLDQIGTFSRSVDDAAALLGAVAGHDARDATSARREVPDYAGAAQAGVAKMRIGLLSGLAAGTAPEILDAVDRARIAFEKAGATICEVALPSAEHALSAYYLIAPAEASSNLARFDGVRYGPRVDGEDLAATYAKTRAAGFGREVRRRIMLGTYALSAGYYDAYYVKAAKARTLIARDFAAAFERCDVVLGPTTPTTAFKLGEKAADPLAMYLSDVFTLPASLAGLPAFNVPFGLGKGGLPIGVHLTGRAFAEQTLFAAARALERANGPIARPPTYRWGES